MNKRIQQRVDELIGLASNMNKDRRRDYNSRLKSFIDKAEKLNKMNDRLFKKGEKEHAMNELWKMYHDTLKHMSVFYSASRWIEGTLERIDRSNATKQVFIDGIENGDILDALHTNLALEHMGGEGFYKIAKPKMRQVEKDWADESWSRNTDNTGAPETTSISDMSESSLEAMLSSYAVTFDNIENDIDRELQHESYLDRADRFQWQ